MNPADPGQDPARDASTDPHVHHVDVGAAPAVTPTPTRRIVLISTVIALLFVLLYVTALLPRRAVARALVAEVNDAAQPPIVQVTTVQRAAVGGSVDLPGTIEALHEGVIYARVGGYVKRWSVDIGSTVRAGDVLAELEAPELIQNVEQAKHQLAQVRAALALAQADLARWKQLSTDSAVSREELDQKQAAFDAASANVGADESNLQRLVELEGYTRVRAPFAGVVTARNIDIGSLITAAGATSAPAAGSSGAAGSLFRIAQTDTVRTFLPVPSNYAAAMTTGLPARIVVQELPGRTFTGRIVRTSHALDAGSRTLLTEVDVANPGFALLPGMYAEVHMQFPTTTTPTLLIPAAALVIRADGPQVMVLDTLTGGKGAVVHLRKVQVGRDYGATIEILSGVDAGAVVVTNPAADVDDGAHVVVSAPPASPPATQPAPPPTKP